MEFEIEERPHPGATIGYRYSDRFVSPQRVWPEVERTRPDLVDRAVSIPDQEPGS
jgi:hypothetical protein